MKYRANFSVNNGTTLSNGIENNNLRNIIKDIRDMMLGQRFYGNKGSWWVIDERGEEVASGGVRRDGSIYRLIK